MLTVYLAGPINGCSDEQANGWRRAAKAWLQGRAHVLDPMARDYRGVETANVNAIVEGDLADIRASDVLLVKVTYPSWGTAMEIAYARMAGKRVVAFGFGAPERGPEIHSPWLAYHVECVSTLRQAVDIVLA